MVAALVLAAPLALGQEMPPRIVVVGDVHGAFDEFVQILQRSGIVDQDLAWSGGTATLVQTGDILDRGADVRQVMDMLMRLQDEAEAAGGRVEVLLGNHEALNIVGVFRDVGAGAFDAFADEDSERLRRREWRQFKRFHIDVSRRTGQKMPRFSDEDEAEWMAAHPPGWFEYREAMAADGTYGRWLRSLPAALRIGDVFFVHGGLGPDMTLKTPEAINAKVADEIRRFDEAREWLEAEGLTRPLPSLRGVTAIVRALLMVGAGAGARNFERAQDLSDVDSWFLISPEGPLWYRGLAYGDESELAPRIEQLFEAEGIAHMVVAHTPQSDGRINARFSDRVFLVDTGLHPGHYAAGRPSALVFDDRTIRALYLDDEEVLVERRAGPPRAVASAAPAVPPAADTNVYVWRDVAGDPSPLQRRGAIARFLERAPISRVGEVGEGSTRPLKVRLEEPGVRIHAVFRSVDRPVPEAANPLASSVADRAVHEVAAYRVDRLLDLGRVPPAVPRTFDGREGSLQAWMEGTIRESERRAESRTIADPESFGRQLEVMRVFDALIGNIDRNQGNMLLDSHSRLWLIDHTRAFPAADEVAGLGDLERCGRRLYNALVALDEDSVHEALDPVIGRRASAALMARRAALVAHFDALMAARGPLEVLFDLSSGEGASPLEDLPRLLEIPATTPYANLER